MTAASKLAAGVVVVRETDDGFVFLLLRAYRNWDCPKGLVEPGEAPLDTAVREAREEAGIVDLAFDWGTDYYETEPYSGGKVARYYLARTEQADVELPVSEELGGPEHHEYRWADLNEAMHLVVPRIQSAIAWAAGRLAAGVEGPIARG